eukprot:TRINITY_DN2374_c0_g1_i1.p1 TRINITY_DN2374_c0_g1~~TRINITY_DN2374_c0_g1_i1.p1  ORF type:complete len:688 (-),score=120.07 TRINITY_DN2374_c0_g1_i1:71-1879(-)
MTSKEDGKVYAGKVIEKASLTKSNALQKLYTEIKNHSLLKHQNVVRFYNYFEDEKSYYLILEMCNHKTLRSLLRKRKHLTEVECRYYLYQILEALHHIHCKEIMHRDLKLDNIFLKNMSVKIGDFGLSVKLENGEKKKTVCGTPNYIAPEVLEKTGHSYPADIWSVGVIMYTLLVGVPPFETPNITETYQRIKDNSYCFPTTSEISSTAKDLISKLLVSNPDMRPPISSVLSHPFFLGPLPRSIPEYTLVRSPENDIRNASPLKNQLAKLPLQPISENIPTTPKTNPHKHFSFVAPSPPGTPTVVGVRPANPQARTGVHPLAAQPNPTLASLARPALSAQGKKRKLDAEKELAADNPQKKKKVGNDDEGNEQIKQFLNILNHQLENMKPIDKENVVVVTDCKSVMIEDVMISKDIQWVSKWVDYSQKYGIGYVLRDGTIGVSFVDKTHIWSSEGSTCFKDQTMISPKVIDADSETDPRIMKRIHLHTLFNKYLTSQVLSSAGLGVELKPNTPLESVYVTRWHKSTRAITFLMSNNSYQINFFQDHTKIIASLQETDNTIRLLFVNPQGNKHTLPLTSLINPDHTDALEKVKYLAHVLSKNFS